MSDLTSCSAKKLPSSPNVVNVTEKHQVPPLCLRTELGKCACANTPVCTRRSGRVRPTLTPQPQNPGVTGPSGSIGVASCSPLSHAEGHGSGLRWQRVRIRPLLLSGFPGILNAGGRVRAGWERPAKARPPERDCRAGVSPSRLPPAHNAPSASLIKSHTPQGSHFHDAGEETESQRGRGTWLNHTAGAHWADTEPAWPRLPGEGTKATVGK